MERVIFLVDMNAFFISCETVRDGTLRGVPAAVAGDPKKRSGIILTANYDARRCGVRTTMTIGQAQRLCPELRIVPCDHHYYSEMSRKVMDILGSYTPLLEQNSVDEAWLDMTGCGNFFPTPVGAAKSIMAKISGDLGLWCSIGIARNKFLSKMAADIKKPQGITTIWPEEIATKLWPLDVGAIYGVGAQTAAKLRTMGLNTIGDVARSDKTLLVKRLGKYGGELHERACGIDGSPVSPRSESDVKSIGRSVTLPKDVADYDEAKGVMMKLAEEVGMDLRRHEKKFTTVQITLRYPDFHTITRQKAVPATNLTADIIGAGASLLRKEWNVSRPVRLIGISVSGFPDACSEQLSFFDTAKLPDKREERLEKTVDGLRTRFGADAVKRASLLDGHKE